MKTWKTNSQNMEDENIKKLKSELIGLLREITKKDYEFIGSYYDELLKNDAIIKFPKEYMDVLKFVANEEDTDIILLDTAIQNCKEFLKMD